MLAVMVLGEGWEGRGVATSTGMKVQTHSIRTQCHRVSVCECMYVLETASAVLSSELCLLMACHFYQLVITEVVTSLGME